MEMWINKDPYWYSVEDIAKIEKIKNAVHMGPWALKTQFGIWTEEPYEVFYQPNPDVSKGHQPYFGLRTQHGRMVIVNATSAFAELPIAGILGDNREVIVSRYRHDYQCRNGAMIDGGRDYTKCSDISKLIHLYVDGSTFRFEKPKTVDIAA